MTSPEHDDLERVIRDFIRQAVGLFGWSDASSANEEKHFLKL